jgi:hypothetical protein
MQQNTFSNIKWAGANMSGLWDSMSQGFVGSAKSILGAIPIGLVIGIAGLFLAMGIYQFLKEVKVI